MHSWHNAFQIRRYLANITNNAKALFEHDVLEQHYTKFIVLSYRAISLYSPEAQDNYHKDLHAYLADVHRICSDIWVKFDPGQMMQGLLFVVFETVFIFLLIGNLKVYQLQKVFTRNVLLFAYISDLFIGVVVVKYTWHLFGFGSVEQAAIVLVSMFNLGFLAFLIMANWSQIAKNLSEVRFSNPFARMLLISSVSVFFSNSFIVQEQKVLCYMLMGVLLLMLFKIQKTNIRFDLRSKIKFGNIFSSPFTRLAAITAVVIVILRNTHSYFRCREEQGNCTDFGTRTNLEADKTGFVTNSDASIYHPTLALAFFVILTRLHLKSCGNLRGYSLHVFFAQSGTYLGGIAIGSYFILSQTSNHGVSQWHIDALAWIIYGLVVAQILLLLLSPLLVDVDDSASPLLPANGITQIFHRIRKELNSNSNVFGDDYSDYVYRIPLIHGLTTIHSSVLISFGSIIALVVALLLGPSSAGGLFLSLYGAAGIAILNGVLRYQTANTLGKSDFF